MHPQPPVPVAQAPRTNALGQPIGTCLTGWSPPPAPTGETLTGRYCRIEKLVPERHAPDLFAGNQLDSEQRMWTYLPYGPFDSYDAYYAWLSAAAESLDPLFLAVIDLSTGTAVGLVGYLRIDPRNGSIEVGHLAYTPHLQRKPAATEAMYLMMKQAFELGYRRYEWKCDALNIPSRMAAERLGFRFEGLFRQAVIYKDRSRDTSWYSIVDHEWPMLRNALEQWLAADNFDPSGQQRTRLSDLTAACRAAPG